MVLRRDKHKTAAKAALEQALGILDRLGALLWAQATKPNSTGSGCVPPHPSAWAASPRPKTGSLN
jgi:hypothetical protein